MRRHDVGSVNTSHQHSENNNNRWKPTLQRSFSPDGSHAYITHYSNAQVSVLDTSTNNVTATVTVGTQPVGAAVTPNGQFVYVTNCGSNTVSVIDTSANQLVATIPVGSYPVKLALTPDGKTGYVANEVSNTSLCHRLIHQQSNQRL